MLARLDEIPGVAGSRVDWTGRRFLLSLEPGAKESLVSERAEIVLGEDARVLGGGEERVALDGYRRGEAWMRAGETLRLSQHEAEVLAERYGLEASREIGLGEGATRRLVEVLARELGRGFERSPRPGDGGGTVADAAEICLQILESSSTFLDPGQQRALEGYLSRFAISDSNR